MLKIKNSSKIQDNRNVVSINIPKNIVEAMGIKKGDMVILEVDENGTLTIKK